MFKNIYFRTLAIRSGDSLNQQLAARGLVEFRNLLHRRFAFGGTSALARTVGKLLADLSQEELYTMQLRESESAAALLGACRDIIFLWIGAM